MSNECRGASTKSNIAITIAVIAIISATWFMPRLINIMNRLSKQLEIQNARNAGRD